MSSCQQRLPEGTWPRLSYRQFIIWQSQFVIQSLCRLVRREMDLLNPCCCSTERRQYVPGAPSWSTRFGARFGACLKKPHAMADKGRRGFPAWRPPLPTLLLQRRRGRSSRRLVAVSKRAGAGVPPSGARTTPGGTPGELAGGTPALRSGGRNDFAGELSIVIGG
jgi:hypothetical protein